MKNEIQKIFLDAEDFGTEILEPNVIMNTRKFRILTSHPDVFIFAIESRLIQKNPYKALTSSSWSVGVECYSQVLQYKDGENAVCIHESNFEAFMAAHDLAHDIEAGAFNDQIGELEAKEFFDQNSFEDKIDLQKELSALQLRASEIF